MATTETVNGTSDSHGPVGRALIAIRSSALLFMATIGFLIFAFGIAVELAIGSGIVDRGIWGIWSAIFAWWGAGLTLAGVVGRVVIWVRRR